MKKKSKILNNILKANKINKKSIEDHKITILGPGAGQNTFEDEDNNPECCNDVPIPPAVPDTFFFFPPYPTLSKETDTELERRARWYANKRDLVIENLFIPFNQSRISLFYFEIMCDGSFSSLWSESISYGLLGAYGNGINDIFHIGNSSTKAIKISKITKENVNYALMKNKSFNPSMFVGTIPMRKVSEVACAGGLLFEAIQYMIDNDFLGNASNLEQSIADLSVKYFSNIEENKLFSFTGETETIIDNLLVSFEDSPKGFVEEIKNNIDVYYNEKYVSFVRDYIILLSRATSDEGYIDSWNNIYGGDSDSDSDSDSDNNRYAIRKCKCELENDSDSDINSDSDSDSDSEFFIEPIDFFVVFPNVPVPQPGQPRPKPPRPPAAALVNPEDICKIIDDTHLAWDYEQNIDQLEPLDAFINRVFPRPLGSSYGLKEANPYHVHFSVQNDVIYLCSLSHYHDATVRSYYLNICEATNIVMNYYSNNNSPGYNLDIAQSLFDQLIDYENLNLDQALPKNILMEFYNDKNFRQYLINNNLLLNYIVPCQGVQNGDFRTKFRTASWVLGDSISSRDTIAVLDPDDEDINFDNSISINEDEPTYIGTSNGTIIGNMISESEALDPTDTDNLQGILLGLIFGVNVVPESPTSLSKVSSTKTVCYECDCCPFSPCDSDSDSDIDSNSSIDSDNGSSTSLCCVCVGPSYGYTVNLSNSGGDIGADKPFGGLTPAGGWGGTITYKNDLNEEEEELAFIIKEPGLPPPEPASNFSPVEASYNSGYKPCRYVEQLQNGVTIQGKTYIINGDDDNAYEYSSAWTLDDGNKKYSVCRNDCDKACCEQCREIDQSSIEKFVETANDPCGFSTSAVNKVCCETAQLYDENNLGSCLCEE